MYEFIIIIIQCDNQEWVLLIEYIFMNERVLK